MIDSGDRERGPVWTCDNGHAISPGDVFCGRCGAYVRPGDLSGSPDAVQPGAEPGQVQAEYADDPSGEYAPLFSSGSFTEFIAATSETDIPPFPAGPFPDEVTPDPYQPPATAVPVLGAPGFGVPGSDAHDEPDATDDGTPDVQRHGTWDEPDATDDGTPDVQRHGTWDGSGHTAPDESGHDDPAVPGGLTPGTTSAGHPAGPDAGETGPFSPGEPAPGGVAPGDFGPAAWPPRRAPRPARSPVTRRTPPAVTCPETVPIRRCPVFAPCSACRLTLRPHRLHLGCRHPARGSARPPSGPPRLPGPRHPRGTDRAAGRMASPGAPGPGGPGRSRVQRNCVQRLRAESPRVQRLRV